MNIFYQLAKNTFKECVREPIFFLMLVTALFLIGMFPTFSLFVFRVADKAGHRQLDATTMTFGLVVAVLCASHTISREMSNGTVASFFLSKPVPRPLFVLGESRGDSRGPLGVPSSSAILGLLRLRHDRARPSSSWTTRRCIYTTDCFSPAP
jgi:hypothetical protein